jgi:hypothetical protein
MRASHLHRLSAIVGVGLQLALSFAFTADLVLCTEASGEVSVESAFSTECCDEHVVPKAARGQLGRDRCGCTDRPLLQSAVETRGRLDHSVDQSRTVVGVASASPEIGLSAFTRSSRAYPSPTPESTLIARRSVVLIV